jgi:hypothetical protein
MECSYTAARGAVPNLEQFPVICPVLLVQGRPKTYLFGVGTAQRDFRECVGLWGGPFVGPEQGDMGDWVGTQISPCSEMRGGSTRAAAWTTSGLLVPRR